MRPSEAKALHFIQEAYKHCKTIAATGAGIELLRTSYAGFELRVEKGSEGTTGVLRVRDYRERRTGRSSGGRFYRRHRPAPPLEPRAEATPANLRCDAAALKQILSNNCIIKRKDL